MKDLEIQRLLLDCGFQVVAAPTSALWAVAGRLDGGAAVRVSCNMGSRGGCVLLVPSESDRRALLALLARNGQGAVDVRAEQMELRTPWLAVGVGLGAVMLFSWVLTSIPNVLP